jgi:hypothetical protein
MTRHERPPDGNGERPPQALSTESVATADEQGSQASTITDVQFADLQLHVAWLRVHADLCYAVDPTGLLSAQLWDHAYCIEAIAEGRR